jgi:hypothetical protein
MSKEDDARKELDDILKGLMTDKKMIKSDKQIIGHAAAMKELKSKPEHAETSRKNAKKQWDNPIDREKKIQGLQKAFKDPEVLANRSKASQEVAQRPEWREKTLANIMNRARPVQDDQSGILHESLTAAARYYNVAIATMQYWLNKSKKDKFYYVN